MVRIKRGLIGLLVALAVSGCGAQPPSASPPGAVQRDVAGRFAAALLRGDAAGARALLVRADDEDLLFLVDQAVAPWRTQHASIRLPARHSGNRWTFSYAGRRTQEDGRFETQRGDLIVVVGPSAGGAGVEYLAFKNVRTRFSTHHDALLMPSKR